MEVSRNLNTIGKSKKEAKLIRIPIDRIHNPSWSQTQAML
jgi:hypothetical protein